MVRQMTELETKLEQYLWDHDGKYPTSDEGLDVLVKRACAPNEYSFFRYALLHELQQLRKRVKLNELHSKFEDGYDIKQSFDEPLDSWPLNGLYCEVCSCPQHDTPSGAVCENSHGGALGLSRRDA